MSQNDRLRANAEEQVTRLLTQLADLEELRAELDDDEYAETKQDTLQQLEEFRLSLSRMAAGDVTLINELESIRVRPARLTFPVHRQQSTPSQRPITHSPAHASYLDYLAADRREYDD